MTTPSNFASVKLPNELVSQAKQAAQPLRRSTAGQIEYWATLGRVVEHSGLTVQEARDAIEGYEMAARRAREADGHADSAAMEDAPESLEAIKLRMLAANGKGSLQRHITRIVTDNRQRAGLPQAT